MTSRVDAPSLNDLTDKENSEDFHVTQSSILYLLQEATKLATPAKQHTRNMDRFCDRSKEHVPSPTASSVSCQNVSNSVTQSNFTGAFSVLKSVQNSSPWEVMSLINLQCEKLLHSGRKFGDEEEPFSCSTKGTDHHRVLASCDLGAEGRNYMECSSFSSSGLTETNTSAVTSRGEATEHDDEESGIFCSAAHIIDGTDVLMENRIVGEDKASAEIEAMDLTELIANNTEGNLYCSGSLANEQGSENNLLAEPTTLKNQASLESSTAVDQENKSANAPSTEALLSPSLEMFSVDFTSDLLGEKDINSSVCSFNPSEKSELGNQMGSNATEESSDISSLPGTDLNNNPHSENDSEEKIKKSAEALITPSTKTREGNNRRTPRKQAHPVRSPDLQDPDLQGVTFSMHSEVDRSTDQCRLLITSNYSEMCRRGRRGRGGRGGRSRSLHNTQRTSSSEEESDPASLSKKICASCCTRKTPLWRDAEDGTPLCNACGIRYKKYRVRCLQCWNIPRKEANSKSKCLKCGDQLASQNKRTAW